MERAELERLDRDTLIERAEVAGVTRARILTRPELIDELLMRSQRADERDEGGLQRARGLFGRARDLLARIVERGLHLPDAAEIIRATRGSVPPPARSITSALPTVTLAEIYATQGHRDRAVETLQRVLDREPEHVAARALLVQLEDVTFVLPEPPLPPEDIFLEASAKADALDDDHSPPPITRKSEKVRVTGKLPKPKPATTEASPSKATRASDAKVKAVHHETRVVEASPSPPIVAFDECIAIPVDPTTLFVYWDVREGVLARLRASRPSGVLVLRFVVIVPTWDGPETETVDHEVTTPLGDWFLRNLARGAVVRAAIGWRTGDVFLPLSHSPALETAAGRDQLAGHLLADTLLRWTLDGVFPVAKDDVDADAIHRALLRARSRLAGAAERFVASSSAAAFS